MRNDEENGEDEFSSNEEDSPGAPRDMGGESADFDDFEESRDYAGGGGANMQVKSAVVSNQPFDEAVELSDEEPEHPSPQAASGAKGGGQGAITNQPFDEAVELSSEGSVDDDHSASPSPIPNQQTTQSSRAPGSSQKDAMRNVQQNFAPNSSAGNDQKRAMAGMSADELREPKHDESDGEGFADAAEIGEGMYDPAEYADLQVNAETKELFQYIGRYKPHNIELETKMRPFVPDYIPAVGEIDNFVKVPRPDGKTDNLGLVVLDEPSSNQSDPTVMTLQLRAVTKSSGQQPMLVRSIESAEKDPKAITGWINSINELHRHKPPPSVRYTKPMPDIEALMQIWPAQFEELLETCQLPDADIQARHSCHAHFCTFVSSWPLSSAPVVIFAVAAIVLLLPILRVLFCKSHTCVSTD